MQGRSNAPDQPEKPAKERTLPIDKDVFSQRLWQAIKRSGLTYKETARRAQEHLPPGMRISDVSVWSYAKGRSLPRRMTHVEALGRVLGVDTQDLLGSPELSGPAPGADMPAGTGVHVDDLGDGRAMLKIAMPAPWPVALEVLRLLKGHAAPEDDEEDLGEDTDPDVHDDTDEF